MGLDKQRIRIPGSKFSILSTILKIHKQYVFFLIEILFSTLVNKLSHVAGQKFK